MQYPYRQFVDNKSIDIHTLSYGIRIDGGILPRARGFSLHLVTQAIAPVLEIADQLRLIKY
jgi:hypothetical protein